MQTVLFIHDNTDILLSAHGVESSIVHTQLPPCEDCLFLHTMESLEMQSPTTSASPKPNQAWLGQQWRWPAHRGLDAGISSPRASAADVVVQARICKLPGFQCMNNGLKCSNMDRLQTCDNQPKRRTLTRWSRRQTWLTLKQAIEMDDSS